MRITMATYGYALLILSGFIGAGLIGWIGLDLMSLALRRRAARLRAGARR